MKDEYASSKGTRGKFYRKCAVMDLPVYLDPEVRGYLAERAKLKGSELNELVNELLKREIALIEAVKTPAATSSLSHDRMGSLAEDRSAARLADRPIDSRRTGTVVAIKQ